MCLCTQTGVSVFDYNRRMKTLLILLLAIWVPAAEIEFEILGSGGPEIDGRASSSYILWIDKRARLLIDTGSGSMLRFEQSGAQVEDLDAIALTHLHIDHVVDLPAYMKAGYFTARQRPLPLIGPTGNHTFPDTVTFIKNLFGKQGAYRYMSDILTPQSDSFELKPIAVDAPTLLRHHFEHFDLSMINVNHGIVPALAFRIDVGSKSIVISGDTSNVNGELQKLAHHADLFIAHHAIGEIQGTPANRLHMTPGVIADIAKSARVRHLVLSHRMKRTLGREAESLKVIRSTYKGPLQFAEDHMKIKL